MRNEECAYFYEEVCCNPECDERGEFVDPEFCQTICRHYQKPDSIGTEETQQE